MGSYKRGSHTVWDCKYHLVRQAFTVEAKIEHPPAKKHAIDVCQVFLDLPKVLPMGT
jgi:hypothetical protein